MPHFEECFHCLIIHSRTPRQCHTSERIVSTFSFSKKASDTTRSNASPMTFENIVLNALGFWDDKFTLAACVYVLLS